MRAHTHTRNAQSKQYKLLKPQMTMNVHERNITESDGNWKKMKKKNEQNKQERVRTCQKLEDRETYRKRCNWRKTKKKEKRIV